MTSNKLPARTQTIIFCARTNHIIDVIKPGSSPHQQLEARMPEYGPDLCLLPADEALQRYEDTFKSEPEEISATRYQEMLGVLPPVAWTNARGGESFRMSERLAGRVTSHFVRIGESHATFADLPTPHEEACERVLKYFATRIP